MLYRYIYINKKNGMRVMSNKELNDPNLELQREIKTVDIQNRDTFTKNNNIKYDKQGIYN